MTDLTTTARLVWTMARADFQNTYAGSVLGYAWVVIGPALLFAVIYAVVTNVLFRFDDQVEDYGVLLLFNITIFTFFSQGTNRAMRSLGSGGALVKRMPINHLVPPLSAVLGAGFGLLGNLTIFVGFFIVTGVSFQITWLLFPIILALAALVTTGTGLLLAGAFVRYRDIVHFWPSVVRVLFYTTVIFPFEFLPRVLQDIQSFNPLAPIIAQARVWLIDPDAPGWFELDRPLWGELAPFVMAILLITAGWFAFRRASRFAAEEV